MRSVALRRWLVAVETTVPSDRSTEIFTFRSIPALKANEILPVGFGIVGILESETVAYHLEP